MAQCGQNAKTGESRAFTTMLDWTRRDAGEMRAWLADSMHVVRGHKDFASLPTTPAEDTRAAGRIARERVEAAVARVPGLDTVAINVPESLPPAKADAALLEQVLVNVLDNAHRYAPSGSLVRVSARVAPRVAGGRITIDVADEGVGIPAADLPNVFDSFYRASRGDRVSPGTGLGLAIARGLMMAMGGTIEAISPRPDAARDGSPGTLIQIGLEPA